MKMSRYRSLYSIEIAPNQTRVEDAADRYKGRDIELGLVRCNKNVSFDIIVYVYPESGVSAIYPGIEAELSILTLPRSIRYSA